MADAEHRFGIGQYLKRIVKARWFHGPNAQVRPDDAEIEQIGVQSLFCFWRQFGSLAVLEPGTPFPDGTPALSQCGDFAGGQRRCAAQKAQALDEHVKLLGHLGTAGKPQSGIQLLAEVAAAGHIFGQRDAARERIHGLAVRAFFDLLMPLRQGGFRSATLLVNLTEREQPHRDRGGQDRDRHRALAPARKDDAGATCAIVRRRCDWHTAQRQIEQMALQIRRQLGRCRITHRRIGTQAFADDVCQSRRNTGIARGKCRHRRCVAGRKGATQSLIEDQSQRKKIGGASTAAGIGAPLHTAVTACSCSGDMYRGVPPMASSSFWPGQSVSGQCGNRAAAVARQPRAAHCSASNPCASARCSWAYCNASAKQAPIQQIAST